MCVDAKLPNDFSETSTINQQIDSEQLWIHNKNARRIMLTVASAFYGVLSTVIGLVIELSHVLSSYVDGTFYTNDLIFGFYMYGTSLIFFIYCYAVMFFHPKWLSSVTKFKQCLARKCFGRNKVIFDERSNTDATSSPKAYHPAPSHASLYLRFGCVAFGVVGMVYYSFSIFICFNDDKCTGFIALLDMVAIVFIFLQMHFVFCNWQMSLIDSPIIAHFGTMHLVSTNLWTWLRFIMIEESTMDQEIAEIFYNKRNSTPNYIINDTKSSLMDGSETLMKSSITEMMYTSIVEYSMLGAVVMFIIWRTKTRGLSNHAHVPRKRQIRIDCTKTTTGYLYGLTDVIQYMLATIGCLSALWKMRLLKFNETSGSNDDSQLRDQTLLDHILLSLGLIGELMFSASGILGIAAERTWQLLTLILIAMHFTRLVQAVIQAVLIYIAGKLSAHGDDELRRSLPGKQAVMFLLVANISMFLMKLFEAEKTGDSEAVINFYGKRNWAFLVRSFIPLAIFYRFHSSVCLAEIWKSVYASKDV